MDLDSTDSAMGRAAECAADAAPEVKDKSSELLASFAAVEGAVEACLQGVQSDLSRALDNRIGELRSTIAMAAAHSADAAVMSESAALALRRRQAFSEVGAPARRGVPLCRFWSAASGVCIRVYNLVAQKRFVVRSSLLSTMLTNKDFQTIYHIFIAIMVWLGLSMVLDEYLETGCALSVVIACVIACAHVHVRLGVRAYLHVSACSRVCAHAPARVRNGEMNARRCRTIVKMGVFWWAFSKMDFVVPCWLTMMLYSFM